MENNNDKLDNVIKYLNFLEKEILEKLSRIEKHLGIEFWGHRACLKTQMAVY